MNEETEERKERKAFFFVFQERKCFGGEREILLFSLLLPLPPLRHPSRDQAVESRLQRVEDNHRDRGCRGEGRRGKRRGRRGGEERREEHGDGERLKRAAEHERDPRPEERLLLPLRVSDTFCSAAAAAAAAASASAFFWAGLGLGLGLGRLHSKRIKRKRTF